MRTGGVRTIVVVVLRSGLLFIMSSQELMSTTLVLAMAVW